MSDRLLMIEDDAALAALVADYLKPFGFEVAAAGTAAEGLRRTADEAFEAILLDLMLPDSDGFEVCRRIRAASDVPILMLTARGHDEDRIVFLEIGADDYLPKPFNPRDLVARLRVSLEMLSGDADLKERPWRAMRSRSGVTAVCSAAWCGTCWRTRTATAAGRGSRYVWSGGAEADGSPSPTVARASPRPSGRGSSSRSTVLQARPRPARATASGWPSSGRSPARTGARRAAFRASAAGRSSRWTSGAERRTPPGPGGLQWVRIGDVVDALADGPDFSLQLRPRP
jgi:CheY-like chemotaxis protein